MFELMEKMYIEVKGIKTDISELKTDVSELKSDVAELKTDVSELKGDVIVLKNDVSKMNITIENEIKPKLEALFDGYKQNSDKLDRIESEVAKHEEVIIKRVK